MSGCSCSLKDVVRALPELQERLDDPGSAGAVIAAIGTEARDICGFELAAAFAISGDHLVASPADPLEHPPSDAVRRRVLARRPRVAIDALLGRGGAGSIAASARARSTLSAELELKDPTFIPLKPTEETIAVLILDRPLGAIDNDIVALFGHMAGLALERAVRRDRQHGLTQQLRFLTSSAEAMMKEAFDAPLCAGTDDEATAMLLFQEPPAAEREWRALLSDREWTVLELLADGRSNREIGEQLFLSAETVKGYVSSLLVKLGVTNRVQAATLFLTTYGSSKTPRSGLSLAKVAR